MSAASRREAWRARHQRRRSRQHRPHPVRVMRLLRARIGAWLRPQLREMRGMWADGPIDPKHLADALLDEFNEAFPPAPPDVEVSASLDGKQLNVTVRSRPLVAFTDTTPAHGSVERGLCRSCGYDTIEGDEYYMVTDKVWAQSGLGVMGGMLCIGCLEAHIGRPLCRQDFSDCLLNSYPSYARSERLRAAMEREATPVASLQVGPGWHCPPTYPLADLQSMVDEIGTATRKDDHGGGNVSQQ